jgi:Fur family ferric uptake transcriptional regulator
VLEVLHEAKRPLTHEQVMCVLTEEYYDKASVWRVLSDLEEKGLLQRMDLGDRIWRYELFDTCRTIESKHAHFMCTDCRDVSCLPDIQLSSTKGVLPSELMNGKNTIIISGVCNTCVS